MIDDGARPLADLTERWVRGWCVSRDRRAERLGAAWLVHVDADTRALEYVVTDPDPSLVEALAADLPDRAWLTTIGHRGPGVAAVLTALTPVTHDEAAMTRALPTTAPAPDGRVAVRVDGDVAYATVLQGGEVAASGQASVVDGDAIFDRISTDARFRRQGLGAAVMGALTGWAVSRRATTGILVASPDGQKLYGTLGWSVVAPVGTFARPTAPGFTPG